MGRGRGFFADHRAVVADGSDPHSAPVVWRIVHTELSSGDFADGGDFFRLAMGAFFHAATSQAFALPRGISARLQLVPQGFLRQ